MFFGSNLFIVILIILGLIILDFDLYVYIYSKFNNIFLFAVSVTTQPGNESELQLYRVLQRANLLSYFDTFIAQGKTVRYNL